MNTCHTWLSLAFILLFSSSLLAYRIHSHEHYDEKFPDLESELIVPTDTEMAWYRYPSLPSHHISDERLRRGWGSGRRRRRQLVLSDH